MKTKVETFLIIGGLCFSLIAQSAASGTGQPPQNANTSPLPADAASAEQLKKLFEAIGVQKQIQSLMTSLASSMEQMLPSGIQLSERQKAQMTSLQTELFSKMMSPEFISSYLDMMVPVYQAHFSKGDVDQIITFYSSPAGQKFVNEQPLIIQEVFPKVMPMMQEHMLKVMKDTNFEQRMKEILADEDKTEEKPK